MVCRMKNLNIAEMRVTAMIATAYRPRPPGDTLPSRASIALLSIQGTASIKTFVMAIENSPAIQSFLYLNIYGRRTRNDDRLSPFILNHKI